MGNLIQYTKKSESIDKRLTERMAELEEAYRSGQIKTETEYYYQAKQMLATFYDSILKPTFQRRMAIDLPVSNDYNQMISEAISDLNYLYGDSKTLSSNMESSYEEAKQAEEEWQQELQSIAKTMSGIQNTFQERHSDLVITEQFKEEAQKGKKEETECNIDTAFGYLTLPLRSINQIKIAELRIDETNSNGFPGNTHVANTLNGELHFDGEEDARNNICDMVQTTKEKWYEYEWIEVSDLVTSSCNEYGFEYEEGISWLKKEEKGLTLTIQCEIESTKPISWINLYPFLPDTNAAVPCMIKSCKITSVDSVVTEVAVNRKFDKNTVINFYPQRVRTIELTFYQDVPYDVEIGHIYYNPVNNKDMSIFHEDTTSEDLPRIDGKNPSITALGVIYDPITKGFSYPSMTDTLPHKNYTQQELFHYMTHTIDSKWGLELLPAKRYLIGIQGIELKSYSFYPYGTFISPSYHIEKPITSILLDADDFIPEGYSSSCLRYFISVDEGINWYPITPIKRIYEENTIYKYNINSDDINHLLYGSTEKPKVKLINTLNEVHSVKVKIEMDMRKVPTIFEEPEEQNESITPLVYRYQLKVTTGGDVIEY